MKSSFCPTLLFHVHLPRFGDILIWTVRCESLRALLPYVEWDRFVTLAGSKSGMRVTLSYLVFAQDILIWINRIKTHRTIHSKVVHIWHSDPYMDRLRPSREYT
jgi:hypothetical protein